ncbi:MAG: alpha/beta hydrolase, partial [Candidatus Heimdallarchaeota archaeon]
FQPAGAGWGGDALIYIETLKPLEKIRTMVYLEPRGIGHSQRVDHPHAYAMKEYVEDLEALRRYLQIPKIDLAGHSHGGFIALLYSIHYPENIERLLLFDTTPHTLLGDYPNWLKKRKGYKEVVSALRKLEENKDLTEDEKERAVLKILLPIIHFSNWNKVSSQVNEILEKMVVSSEPHNYYSTKDVHSYDVREFLGDITVPTLIVTGEEEMPHIAIGSKILYNQMPNAILAIIKNCGHWPMLESPEEFFRNVLAFLTESYR